MIDSNLILNLLDYWSHEGNERCGLIYPGWVVKEKENIHPTPFDNFALEVDNTAIATWHTHPRTSANLTKPDLDAFKAYPDLMHFIISHQNIWCYVVQNDAVIFDHDNSYITRAPKRAA